MLFRSGIIYAIHLKPEGSTYSATAEEFLSGAPLSLTDGIIGPDGALYFLTGGRRLDSDLYRVSAKDSQKYATEKAAPSNVELTEENKIRRSIENYHKKSPDAINTAWPYLSHPDRFVRYAARIAVENQPIATWRSEEHTV